MATSYNGMLLRANLADSGAIPRAGPYVSCPDIIPYQQNVVQDPQATFGSATGSATSYDRDPGMPISIGNVNYIHLRGKNLGTTAIVANSYLWFAPSQLILWPGVWLNDQYQIRPDQSLSGAPGGATEQFITLSAAPGAIAVTPAPFAWANPSSPPSGTNYGLVAITGTAEQVAAMRAAALNIKSLEDFAAWIANNGGVGWRNLATTSANTPDFSTAVDFHSGSSVAQLMFQLVAANIPAGAEIALSAGTPNDGGPGFYPIVIPPTPVPGAPGTVVPSYSVGLRTNVIANYQSAIYYEYKSNGAPTPSGFSLTVQVTMIVSGGALARADLAPLHAFVTASDRMYDPASNGFVQGPPPGVDADAQGVIVGSHTTQFHSS